MPLYLVLKEIVKNYIVDYKDELCLIDDKNEIGLDFEQKRVLIKKHVTTWLKHDDGVVPIFQDDPEINDPLNVNKLGDLKAERFRKILSF